MAILKQSTAYTRMFKMIASSDHLSAKTSASPVVNISKNGGAFAAAGGAVTEVTNGWYKIALTTTDTNTLGDLAFYITGTGADDTDFVDQVAANILGDTLPANVTNFGGTAVTARDIGASVLLSNGTGAGQISLSSGTVTVGTNNDKTGYSVSSNVKKNQSLAGFTFVMTDSTNHNPATGLTVTGQRSLDGAAFASCANAVSSVGSGVYKIDLAATDLNANTVDLRFTATGADDLNILIITQP